MWALWAYQDRDELRTAIWNWMTQPASDPAPGKARRVRRAQLVCYAFELWIGHLVLIEQMMELTPPGWREMRAAEAEGIQMLRAARQRYAREYRNCGECGAPVRGKICPRCGALGGDQPVGL